MVWAERDRRGLRQRFSAAAAACALAMLVAAVPAVAASPGAETPVSLTLRPESQTSEPARAVVEIFTSQSCSACPPADQTVARYADDRDMLVMTFPVDYWDYLGWTDTLATRISAQRQFAYADRRRDRQVYTPQVIIDGAKVSGGNSADIARDIAQATADAHQLPVGVSLALEEGVLRIRVSAAGQGYRNATIWLASLDPDESVAVTGGENSGRTLHYRNIVRDLRAVGIWTGSPVEIGLPAAAIVTGQPAAAVPGSPPAPGAPKAPARYRWRSAVLVQAESDNKPGEILGASWVEYEVGAE